MHLYDLLQIVASMGAECQGVLNKQQPNQEYKPQGIHEPPSYYALKIQNPKELPFDLNDLRTMHQTDQPPKPQWYPSKQTFFIDHTFLILAFGVYYHGEWLKGVPYGRAEIFTKQGEYFKGYLKQGVVQCQRCLFVSSPSKYYDGGVSGNRKCGRGKFVDSGYIYQGEWADNLPHGSNCSEIFPNGDRFEGSFRKGEKQQGTYRWKQGPYQSYSGYFQSNEIYGMGELQLRNGATWSGYFDCSKNNLEIRDAVCKMDGQTFQGEIEELRPVGKVQLFRKEIIGSSCVFRGKVFEGRLLTHYDNQFKNAMREILTKVEMGYQNCQKHSEAISRIEKSLPDLRVAFHSQGEIQEGVIIPICGRQLKLTRK